MAEYSGELKMVKKSVRITETMEKQIEAFPGLDFSGKFRNMIDYCFYKMPALNQEYYDLVNEVDKLRTERQDLMREVSMLQETIKRFTEIQITLDKLQHEFTGEMIGRQRKNIVSMIEQQYFKATPEVVEQIRRLNEITGKNNNLTDISMAYKEESYENDSPEAARLVKSIYEEFQRQEMELQCIEELDV